MPISTFDLREYHLQNQTTTKPFTFQLIHQSSSKSAMAAPLSPSLPSPDLYLQAENEKEWGNWVDTLERHVGDQQHVGSPTSGDALDIYHHDQVDVLDKWLERYDLIVPRTDRCTSSLLSLAPSSSYGNEDDNDVDDDNESDLEDLTREQQQPSAPHVLEPSTSANTRTSSSSSSRFLGFLWTVNAKKTRAASGPSSPVTSTIH